MKSTYCSKAKVTIFQGPPQTHAEDSIARERSNTKMLRCHAKEKSAVTKQACSI